MADNTERKSNWKELAAQKEREWKEVTELRMETLEAAYVEKDKQLNEEKSKLQKLKEDFKYNLKLLEERDQELDRYDKIFVDLKTELSMKNGETSELKIQIDDLKSVIARDNQAKDELQRHYQQRLKEKQAEVDSFKCNKDAELQDERKEFEQFKRNLQRKMTEVEEELDTQRRELETSYEDVLKKREHEFRVNSNEMNSKVLEYELKAKLLAKELEIMKSMQKKNSDEYKQVETSNLQLDKILKEKDWELADCKAMYTAKTTELENKLQQTELSMNRMKEDFQRKHAEMDRYGREKEAALAKVKEGYAEREQSLQNTIRDLQSKLEDSQVEIRKLQWSYSDLQKEKEIQAEKLNDEIVQLKEKWDKQIVEVSRSQVNKDIEVQTRRENEEKLRAEINQKKQDIERYKKELSQAADREASLDRSQAQLELDWQRRFEDVERNQYEKSEELIQKLTRNRDDALATVKEKNRELEHRETLIRTLYRDREQALSTLKKHGITVDKNINVDIEKGLNFVDKEQVENLKQQNQSLKSVIKEMRTQMENLGHDLPQMTLMDPVKKDSSNEYVTDLEDEIKKLRQKTRDLESQISNTRKHGQIPTVSMVTNEHDVMSQVKDNHIVKCHIQSLNETLGALRTEKIELSAQVKKQQARIIYLDNLVDKLSKEPKTKQIEIDQLQYEVGAQGRRSVAEIASLKQRVSDLEIQLVEARKEADEYYKGNLEKNMDISSLSQQISQLKIDLSEKRPVVNFGAQELVIQQLQDEMSRLKQQASHVTSSGPIRKQSSNVQVEELQEKLKSAAKHIAQLAKERQQLIEMGNRLRAELKKAGVAPPSNPHSTSYIPPSNQPTTRHIPPSLQSEDPTNPLSQQFLNKLTQLEKLQYELTKQQLQYAQKFPEDGKSTMGSTSNNNNNIGQTQEEYRPPSILKKSIDFADQDEYMDVRGSYGERSLASTNISIPESDGKTQREQLGISMSSVGGESLQEIWKLLEDRPTPTPRSPLRKDTRNTRSAEGKSSSEDFVLQGSKPTYEQRSKSQPYRPSVKPAKKKVINKQHVRNYNWRDGDNS
ncbi:coiled-coil domain-containing protein 57-like [Mytilus trossulus]|uniref:coiled-coil domain-containing protein 57-like n=1 Tax=Mytilus trossulus TaxID=6551 RepID=UPI003004607E